MTIILNTFQTFQSIGNREELSDIIYNISPTATPFMQNAGRGKVDNVFFEWQTDALAAAGKDRKTGVLEGVAQGQPGVPLPLAGCGDQGDDGDAVGRGSGHVRIP